MINNILQQAIDNRKLICALTDEVRRSRRQTDGHNFDHLPYPHLIISTTNNKNYLR